MPAFQISSVVAGAMACVFVGLLTSRVAEAAVTVKPMELRVSEAELVVSGRVRTKEEFTYLEDGSAVPCGITYTIDVLNTYKGSSLQHLKFSVFRVTVRVLFHKVNVGDDLLLLLHTEGGRSDPAPAEIPDVIFGDPSPAKARCLDRLAPLRIDSDDGAYPLIHEPDQRGQTTTWLAYTRARTTIPDIAGQRPYANDCRGGSCDQDGRRLVRWEALEPKIKEWVRTP